MKLELHVYLRKRKLWIAMICVLLCGILTAMDLKEKAASEYRSLNIQALEYEQKSNNQMMTMFLTENTPYQNALQEKTAQLKEGIQKKDWPVVNASFADVYLLEAKRISALYEIRNPELYYHNYVTETDTLERLRKERGLPLLDEEAIRLDWSSPFMDGDETQYFPFYQYQARFFDALDHQHIDLMTYSTTDSATIIVQFMRSLFPILPVILITLICFDAIHEDEESGVIKTLLSQPVKRCRYLHKKMQGHMAAILVIFLLPLLAISLVLGVSDHYESIQAPVLANVQGITSMNQMENTLAEMEKNNEQVKTLGITRYFSVPHQTSSPNTQFDFMPMWQFTLFALMQSILVLAFCMFLNMLMNVLCRHKMASLVLTLGILIIGMGMAQPQNTASWYAWLPFTYFNPVDILSGYSSYTYLNGIVVLTLSCVILYGITRFLFQRKDAI